MKRIRVLLALLAAVILLVPTYSIEAASAGSIQISEDGSYDPGALDEGQSYAVKGKITSQYKLTSVTVGIYKKNGKTELQTAVAAPRKKSYSIRSLGKELNFKELTKGTYYLIIRAEDESGAKATLVKNIFTVGPVESTLSIGDGNYEPSSMLKKTAYPISGTVSSNYKIKKLTVGIYKNDGETEVQAKTVKPKANSYDISRIASKITFETLKTGTYRFIITAKDASGTEMELVNKKFRIMSAKDAMDEWVEGCPQYYVTKKGKLTRKYVSGGGLCTDSALTTMLQRKEVLITGKKPTITFKMVWKAEHKVFSSWADLNVGDPKHMYHVRPIKDTKMLKKYAKNLEEFDNLLDDHPEGVCVYCNYPTDTYEGTHAIVISKKEDGIYYAYDPVDGNSTWNPQPMQRPVEQTWLASEYPAKYTKTNAKTMKKLLKSLIYIYYIED